VINITATVYDANELNVNNKLSLLTGQHIKYVPTTPLQKLQTEQ